MTKRARTPWQHKMSPSGPGVAPLLGAMLAFMATACGSPDEAAPPVNTGGTGATSMDPVGQVLDAPRPCTAEHTICATVQIPSDMSPNPALLRFDIYDSPDPPSHPPNGLAGLFPSPELVAGEGLHVELTDGGLTGTYWLWPLIYMPREGQYGPPAIGDFVMMSPAHELPLDGSPINLEEPIVLQRHAAQ